ncbi:MAG: hypothetical protein QM496_01585 [Verrucomicrobiota bacterium]
MIATSLKKKVEALAPEDRRQLMGYMVSLQLKEDGKYLQTLTAKIDDNDPKKMAHA